MDNSANKVAKPKLKLKLSGQDGKALLALAYPAAMKAGWTYPQWSRVESEAKGGDHTHLLETLAKHFDVS